MNHKGNFEYIKFQNLRESYNESIKNMESMNFDFKELVEDFPRFTGHMSIGRYLTLYELYRKTEGIAGHICEVGTFKGSSLLWFTKLIKIYEPNSLTQVHGFDWFKGTGKDSVELKIEEGSYSYNYEELIKLIKFQNLENSCFVHKIDVVNELEDFFINNPHFYFKLAFLDAGFYDVVKRSLIEIWPRLNKGGILILDQFGHELSPGEAIAVKEILPEAKILTLNNSWMPMSYIIKE